MKAGTPTVVPKNYFGYDKWYNGFWPGYPLAALILLFSLAFFCVEVARLFTGTLNRNPLYSYGLYPGNIYFPPYYSPTNSYNVERQHHFTWPWSTPALLFSTFFFLAGLFACTSARRGTYSMIYLFYTFTLLSIAVMPFIIAYYSTDINRLNKGQVDWHRIGPANRDRSLSIVMLVLSVVMLPLFVLALLCSMCAFDCCWPKGGSYYKPITGPTQPVPVTKTTLI